jgi:hypothetical protein
VKHILTNILTRNILSKVFLDQETDEAQARADSTEITVDSTFVTADGLVIE